MMNITRRALIETACYGAVVTGIAHTGIASVALASNSKIEPRRLSIGPDEICRLTVSEMSAAFQAKTLSPVEALKATIARADAINPHLSSFYWRLDDTALSQAQASEQRWANKAPLSALDGIPFTAKDALAVIGAPSFNGTRVNLYTNLPQSNSQSVQAIMDMGAVLFAKTTMPETGLYNASISALYGPTRNPWNLDQTPGGSSSGAAAATGAFCGPMHLGADGGGSLRVPAAMCGSVVLKVSAHTEPFGFPMGTGPFDKATTGLITRNVKDQALVHKVLRGLNTVSDTSSERSFRIAYLPNPIDDPGVGRVHPEVAERVDAAVARLSEGYRIERVDKIVVSGSLIANAVIAAFERTAANYKDLPPDRLDQFHPQVKQNILEGLSTPAGASEAALMAIDEDLTRGAASFDQLMDEFDILLMAASHHPSFPATASAHPDTPKIPGRDYAWSSGASPHFGWLPGGPPAIIVPCDVDKSGVPIALMAVARAGQDALLLDFGARIERSLGFRQLF